MLLLRTICICTALLRHNWYRHLKMSQIGPFLDATCEEAHFSYCWSLVREGNKYWISLHERREIEIWIGVANACQCFGCFGYGGWNVFLCVCACQCVTDADRAGIEWFSTSLAWSYFPITSREQKWHRWSECFKRKSNLKDKPSHSSL